jgi:transglutaminase-like putative cysteine protease
MNSVADGRVCVAPVPAWVAHDPYELDPGIDDAFVNAGRCLLLLDSQVDISGGVPAWHMRIAHRIITQAGAESASSFSAQFDPEFQRVEVHHLRVIRGEIQLDHLCERDVDLLRREQNLERRQLNGQLTVTQIIPDVRPNDVVEKCWTVYGDNPVLAGRFFQWVSLEHGEPALAIRHRLRAPASRAVRTANHGDVPAEETRETEAEISDRRWTVTKRPRIEIEPLTPTWEILAASIQFSEAADWKSVVDLYLPHYAVDDIPKDFADEIREASRSASTDAEKAATLLRFVQERLRYLAISYGEGGLAPRPLSEIWTSGYGDCKDAARLFVAAARLSGIDAVPALMSSRYGPVIDSWLPSATVFDHCIVRVKVDGESYWLDPTLRPQRGTLAEIWQPRHGWALPIAPEATTLEEMKPPPAKVLFETIEKFELGPNFDSPATMTVQHDYSFGNADTKREQLANQGLGNYAKSVLKHLDATWPGVIELEAPRVEDNEEENRVRVVAKYKVPSPWKSQSNNMASCAFPADGSFSNSLVALKSTERKHDIYLGTPRILRRRVEIGLPRSRKNWNITSSSVEKDAPGLAYKNWYGLAGTNLIAQDQQLSVTTLTAGPDAAKEYSDLVDYLRQRSGLVLRSRISGLQFVDDKKKTRGISPRMIFFAVWALFMLLMLVNTATHHQ